MKTYIKPVVDAIDLQAEGCICLSMGKYNEEGTIHGIKRYEPIDEGDEEADY